MANINPQERGFPPQFGLGKNMTFAPVTRSVPEVNGSVEGALEREIEIAMHVSGVLLPTQVRGFYDPDHNDEPRLHFSTPFSRISGVDSFINEVLAEEDFNEGVDDSVENVLALLEEYDEEFARHGQEVPEGERQQVVHWLSEVTATELIGGAVMGLRRQGKEIKKHLEYEPPNLTIFPEEVVDRSEPFEPKKLVHVRVYQFDEEPAASGILSHTRSRLYRGEV